MSRHSSLQAESRPPVPSTTTSRSSLLPTADPPPPRFHFASDRRGRQTSFWGAPAIRQWQSSRCVHRHGRRSLSGPYRARRAHRYFGRAPNGFSTDLTLTILLAIADLKFCLLRPTTSALFGELAPRWPNALLERGFAPATPSSARPSRRN